MIKFTTQAGIHLVSLGKSAFFFTAIQDAWAFIIALQKGMNTK